MKPRQPPTIAASSSTQTCAVGSLAGSSSATTSIVPAEIAEMPEARPSSPSMKFTALVIATIQITVTA